MKKVGPTGFCAIVGVGRTPHNLSNHRQATDQTRVHADKAYCSKKHRAALKERGIKNGIQDKAVKNKPLGSHQLARNSAISKVRFVVERTFGSQQRWFGGKTLRYQGLAKSHAWHVLLAVAYNLKRLPRLYVESLLPQLPQAKPA
ncbi:transposase [Methyloglobulus sp.]|uniref:transposase n=1 Tax=Methyloglobulus sp. TaxID=2518622 RepID=UPI0032B849A4